MVILDNKLNSKQGTLPLTSLAETANRAETLHHQDATKKILVGSILFFYHEESLVSSNLNSKLPRFHSFRTNVPMYILTGKMQKKSKSIAYIVCKYLHDLKTFLRPTYVLTYVQLYIL